MNSITNDAAIQTFVSSQNVAPRGSAGVALEYDASDGAVVAGENAVIGLQSATFASGYNVMVLANPAADYQISIDGYGDYTITDTTTSTTVSGSGLSYIIFDNAATTTTGSGATAATTFNQELFLESAVNVQIAAFYQGVLGRQPDLSGMEYWANDLAKGDSLVDIANAFINSTEFIARFPSAAASADQGGPHDQAFVTALYNNILDRAPDTAGLNYWVNSLATGTETRATLLTAFTGSTENLSYITAANGTAPLTTTTLPLGTATQWLVNEGTGGFTSSGASQALMTGQAEFNIAATTGVLNFNVIDLSTLSGAVGVTTASANVASGGSISMTSGVLTVTASDITVIGSVGVPSSILTGNNDTVTNCGYVTIIGSNEVVNLSGTNNSIIIQAPSTNLPTTTYGQSVVVTGYVPGQDALTFLDQPQFGGGHEILTPTAANPASIGAQLGSGAVAYLINVGSIGSGTAAEVAAAANKVYTVTGQSAGQYNGLELSIPEQCVFFGTTTTGNTVLEYWVNPSNGKSAAAGGHEVTASEFGQTITLVGVNATSLTAADFK